MRYFTREQHSESNSNDPKAIATAIEEFRRCCELYRRQLDALKGRLSEDAWTFFGSVSLHDGTLLAMHVGDDIHKRFPTYRSILVNKRQLSVELEVLNHDESQLFALRYERLHRVTFDFASPQP
jgi:hypothetical protein